MQKTKVEWTLLHQRMMFIWTVSHKTTQVEWTLSRQRRKAKLIQKIKVERTLSCKRRKIALILHLGMINEVIMLSTLMSVRPMTSNH